MFSALSLDSDDEREVKGEWTPAGSTKSKKKSGEKKKAPKLPETPEQLAEKENLKKIQDLKHKLSLIQAAELKAAMSTTTLKKEQKLLIATKPQILKQLEAFKGQGYVSQAEEQAEQHQRQLLQQQRLRDQHKQHQQNAQLHQQQHQQRQQGSAWSQMDAEAKVAELLNMGFPDDQAREAVNRFGSVTEVNMLLELVLGERLKKDPQAPPNAAPPAPRVSSPQADSEGEESPQQSPAQPAQTLQPPHYQPSPQVYSQQPGQPSPLLLSQPTHLDPQQQVLLHQQALQRIQAQNLPPQQQLQQLQQMQQQLQQLQLIQQQLLKQEEEQKRKHPQHPQHPQAQPPKQQQPQAKQQPQPKQPQPKQQQKQQPKQEVKQEVKQAKQQQPAKAPAAAQPKNKSSPAIQPTKAPEPKSPAKTWEHVGSQRSRYALPAGNSLDAGEAGVYTYKPDLSKQRHHELRDLETKLATVEANEVKWKQGKLRVNATQLKEINTKQQLVRRITDLRKELNVPIVESPAPQPEVTVHTKHPSDDEESKTKAAPKPWSTSL